MCEACAWLVLRLLYVFVSVCVCIRLQLSRALSYVIPTIATSAVEATGSLQAQKAKVRQARLVLCCLDGERVVGNDDNSVLAVAT